MSSRRANVDAAIKGLRMVEALDSAVRLVVGAGKYAFQIGDSAS